MAVAKSLPSVDLLRQLFRYESETGKLYWRKRTPEMFAYSKNPLRTANHFNGNFANKEAGSIDNKGYVIVGFCKTYIKAHRIIWVIENGKDPENHIDHINGIKSDNRICNLREATNSQNIAAGKVGKISHTGITGVYYRKDVGKFTASFRKDKKLKHLGYFETIQEAEECYQTAFKKAFGEYARN